jgi:hypothetical protein
MKTKLFFITMLAIIGVTVNAQTNVSGGIYSNTTWTKANSPYIVTDTVVVFPGVTLTIQPGVTVKFDNGNMIEVRGNLMAEGTSADSITFTSNAASPTPGIYYGIDLSADTLTSKYSYCTFKYATCGIQGYDTLVIKHSNFYHNVTGLRGEGEYNIIDTCNFYYNISFGVNAMFFGNFNYCNFSNNNIGIFPAEGDIFKNCNINNNYTGIYDQDGGNSFINCNIFDNDSGLYNQNGGDKIFNTHIYSNSVEGIEINGAGSPEPDSILNCLIVNNGIGLSYSSWGGGLSSRDIIKCNVIDSNNIGILLGTYSNGTIVCNKICSNTMYDLKYTSTGNISLLGNYWGTTDSASTESVIYDGYDNASYGLVSFMPIDTTKCYLTGCDLSVSATVTNATCDTCQNGSATGQVANGFPPYTWTWYTSPIQTTQTATGLKPGTYTLCVTDSKGCTACNHPIFIDSTNCAGFAITTHSSNATCTACNDGIASVIVTGGTPPYHYTWYTIPMQSTSTATGLTHGAYHVCVTDLYGCTECDSVTVSTGNCSAHFNLYPDTTTPHHYFAVNMASGIPPISYYWNWGDGKHDTTAFPNHNYAVAGFYTICLTIIDSAGCTNMYCDSFYLQKSTNGIISVDVIPNTVTGINNDSSEQMFVMFPNPATNTITIDISKAAVCNGIKQNTVIEITNIQGQLINTFATNTGKTIVDVSAFPSGVYFVKVKTTNGIAVKKFIKE